MLLLNINVFSQTSEKGFPKLMYVTAKDGLRERAEPSTNSKINRTLIYGEFVQVFARQNTPVTINGITDYWYSTIYYLDRSDSWLFGGYLSEELPKDLPVIIGRWDVEGEGNSRRYYQFEPNNEYAEGIKETDMGFFGTWKLNGNIITIYLSRAGNIDEIEKTETIYLTIIDRNNIQLKFNGGTVNLKRNKTGW